MNALEEARLQLAEARGDVADCKAALASRDRLYSLSYVWQTAGASFLLGALVVLVIWAASP